MKQLAVYYNSGDFRPGQETNTHKEQKMFTAEGEGGVRTFIMPDPCHLCPSSLRVLGGLFSTNGTRSNEVPQVNGNMPFVPTSVCFPVFGTPTPLALFLCLLLTSACVLADSFNRKKKWSKREDARPEDRKLKTTVSLPGLVWLSGWVCHPANQKVAS